MPESDPHPLNYESPKKKARGSLADRLIFVIGCTLLAGGLGVSIDPRTVGPGIMALGGLLIGLVYPLRIRPEDW